MTSAGRRRSWRMHGITEDPTYDNSANVYEVIVEATDEGGLTSTPQTITVTLEDALAPTINPVVGNGAVQTTAPGGGAPTATLTIAEGNAAVYGFTASDETDVYWSITGGADQDKFVIDADTGALSFKTVDVDNNNAAIDLPEYVSLSDPNYDAATSNRFEVTIQASDSTDLKVIPVI